MVVHYFGARRLSFSARCSWLATRRFKRELKTRDGLMLVALTWVALPAVAGFPLWHYLPINFTDAYFEAASGLTHHRRHGALRASSTCRDRSICGGIC